MEQANGPLRLGLQIGIRSAEQPADEYTTRVEDFTESSFDVHRPTGAGFVRGSVVELSVTRTDPPGKEGRYEATTKVLDVLRDPMPILRLAVPETWERTQVREFFRVPAALDAQVRIIDRVGDEGDGTPWNTDWMAAQTRDISAGGCQLVLRTPLSRGDTVELVVELPDHQMNLRAVVRRCEPDPELLNHFVIGVSFTNMDEEDRQHLLRFAFQRQIELRKKGLS